VQALAVSLYPLAINIIPLERKAHRCRAVRKNQNPLNSNLTVCYLLEWLAKVISEEICVLQDVSYVLA